MDQLAFNTPILNALGLGGLIHVWGNAGSGKTLFAVSLASDVSKYSRVEWINTDAKKSFVAHLKKNVIESGGRMENITVTLTESRSELRGLIDDLPRTLVNTSLVIIDPITRVLDMAREDPILWGRELVEEVLPILTGIASKTSIDIVIISESRMMENSKNQAVHHNSITRWIDHDLFLSRNMNGTQSQIFRMSENGLQEIAVMNLVSNGILEVIPRLCVSERLVEENERVW
ncbi:MAG: hypothetical protein ACFFDV_05150 [Candidatus Thorarchaeota archaeon]